MIVKTINYKIIFALFCTVVLFYPIIAIFTFSFLMVYDKKFDNYITFTYTILFFTLMFYLRLYGPITSINSSSDDAITYLRIYDILNTYGYLDFFKEAALLGINTLEPLYWFLYYTVGLLTGYNKSVFVILNYFIPIFIFVSSLKLIFKEKYLLAFLLISTFGYQYYYALVFSTWRQSLAFSIIIFSLYLIAKKKNKQALLLLLSAVLIHLSSIIYLFIYITYILITSKIKLMVTILGAIVLFAFLYILLQYYNDILVAKFSSYSSGKHIVSQVRNAFIFKFIGAIVIASFIFKKSYVLKDIQLQVFSFFVMIGNMLVLATMNLGTVTTRLQLSINLLFLVMMTYYIFKYYDYSKKIYIFVLLLVFIIFIRLTVDQTFFSMFLLDGNFNEVIIYSIDEYFTLINLKRGFE